VTSHELSVSPSKFFKTCLTSSIWSCYRLSISHQCFLYLVAELPDLYDQSYCRFCTILLSNLDQIGRYGHSVGCLQLGPKLISIQPSKYYSWQHKTPLSKNLVVTHGNFFEIRVTRNLPGLHKVVQPCAALGSFRRKQLMYDIPVICYSR
jgi:hypothetical protein